MIVKGSQIKLLIGFDPRDLRGVDFERMGKLRDEDQLAVSHPLNGPDQPAAIGGRYHVTSGRRRERK